MKQLWIVNTSIGDVCEELGINHTTSGGWMESFLDWMKKNPKEKVVVVSTCKRNTIVVFNRDNIKYIVLPLGLAGNVNWGKKGNIEYFDEIIREEKPDLALIWGTEFPFSLCLRKTLPIVIYMQGVISSIFRHYEAGLSRKELFRSITLRDIARLDWIGRQKAKLIKKMYLEKKTLQRADSVIVENNWCASMCLSINPEINVLKCPLSINPIFFNKSWTASPNGKPIISTNASGYPIKGLHILLRALFIVKRRFPDIQLNVPGGQLNLPRTLSERLRMSGYTKFISRLIKDLGLEENVRFLGRLTTTSLIDGLLSSKIFVLSSSIENHSSSLKEAMALGLPCVSSYVGGIPEYIINEKNGILYRFEEYEDLANKIIKVLDDEEYAKMLSVNAMSTIRELHGEKTNNEKLLSRIYEALQTASKINGAKIDLSCDN